MKEKLSYQNFKDFSNAKMIYKGAEAELWKIKYLNLPAVEKRRVEKKYRIKEIDSKIRKERIKNECKVILSARKTINAPHIYDVDTKENTLTLEFIKGEKIKDLFLKGKKIEVSRKIGKSVRKMHEKDIIHNDLTTSNMILKDGEVYFIDFGLGVKSRKTEDKAVDLLVFKRMLKSTHWKYFDKIWKSFIGGYADKKVLKKVEEVEKRARYL